LTIWSSKLRNRTWVTDVATFTALYDACVLYPAPLRDLLMELAGAGLFRARWTDEIHNEWIENLLENEPHRERARLERTRDLMNAAVLDCLVTGYEPLTPALILPDPDDRHVLAAAIRGRADVIVTYNLKHFPDAVLSGYGIEAQHPDEFVSNLTGLDAEAVYTAVKNQRARLKNPPKSAEEFLETLEKQSLAQTVANLRRALDLI
jgi:predicted nucleic acid-binding protein